MMTRYFSLKVLTTYLITFFFLNLNAQDSEPYENPKFGPDSLSRMECAHDLSTLAEYMNINLPEYALPSWRKLFGNCPGASKNIYISGAKIFQYLIEKETDASKKKDLYDTLMLIYDKRIEYFQDEGYVLGRKGVDIIRFYPEDFPAAYVAFKKSTELSGNETDLNIITGLVQTASAMYKKGDINTEELMSNYFTAIDIYDYMISQKKSIPKVKRSMSVTEKIIMNTGIRDCEGLQAAFIDRFESKEPEKEDIQLAIDLLSTSGCESTELYSEANEMLMKLDPDPEVAYEVARFNLQNENYTKATEYLKLAIEYEIIPDKKALYLQQMALINLSKLSNPVEAREYAREAVKVKSDWGEPYFVMAAAVIEGSNQCKLEDFDRQAVYWLAVDYCNKAKSTDPSVSDKANELIAQYKAGFPSVEETFFRSLKEGDPYKINCWINESTTVKSK